MVTCAAILGATSAGTWVLLAAIVLVGFPVSIWRYRVRGPGVGWVPKRFRSRLNRAYELRGWKAPYDAEGNKQQDW